MRKILQFLLGGILGGAAGAGLVALFSPVSGRTITTNLKRGWVETMDEARQASQARQAELEAQFEAMRASRRKQPVAPG
jgi:gas vesicle protein